MSQTYKFVDRAGEGGALFDIVVGFIRLLDLAADLRQQTVTWKCDDSTWKGRGVVVRNRVKQETTWVFELMGNWRERILHASADYFVFKCPISCRI
jgi:precorrin-6B methylase 1